MSPWIDEDGRPVDPREPAAVCENGHLVNGFTKSDPVRTTQFCARCGAAVITACPVCAVPIPGSEFLVGNGVRHRLPAVIGAYCGGCGSTFPWTARRLDAARDALSLDDALAPADREALLDALPDITRETPRTPVALERTRRLLAKLTPAVRELYTTLVVPIAVEYAKRKIEGP